MLRTRKRAKSESWTGWRTIAFACALILGLLVQTDHGRADVVDWLTNLLTTGESVEDASRTALPDNAIVTGPDERRTIEFGRDVLYLYPSTVVTLQEGSTVRLISGTVRVKAAKRKNGKTLSVETRMLVATVKGTDFEVSIVADASAVSVYEGRVAVKAVGVVGGIDVTPGKTATVTAGDKGGKLRNTPQGGAPEAAKQAAKAGGSADGSKPSKAPKHSGQPGPNPLPANMDPPAPAGPPADDPANKPSKPEKPDKKKDKRDKEGPEGPEGPGGPGPH